MWTFLRHLLIKENLRLFRNANEGATESYTLYLYTKTCAKLQITSFIRRFCCRSSAFQICFTDAECNGTDQIENVKITYGKMIMARYNRSNHERKYVRFTSLIIFVQTFCCIIMTHYVLKHTDALSVAVTTTMSDVVARKPSNRNRFLIIGGTGKVGSSVAKHLLLKQPGAHIILAGRNPSSQNRLRHVLQELELDSKKAYNIDYLCCDFNQQSHALVNTSEWIPIFQSVDCIIHTAGPYIDCIPRVLQVAIEVGVPVYVDVSDPLPYLEYGISFHQAAMTTNKTTALLAAGAYPGMSNVLGIDTAVALMKATQQEAVQDVRYNFFAAGLGGIGLVNLYITNVGFGDPIALYENGQLRLYTALSGMLLGTVDFFFPSKLVPVSESTKHGHGNDAVKKRVGTKQVFAWPFPEGATVPTQLKARGSSSVAMGVAPDLWNTILGLLVTIVPRKWWRSQRFSQFMADFSQPLVILTDKYMKFSNSNKIGETHCMRIDVTSADGKCTMSTIQAHDSLRNCVGQSCAEFALDCLKYPKPGVYYPEQRYQSEVPRTRIIDQLTDTDGTFCFIGPIDTSSDTSNTDKVTQPSNIDDAMNTAKMMEVRERPYK
jgi:NAD(P)-dependent dehydrogenase (short-subunit alcohol dehydrogenase family)